MLRDITECLVASYRFEGANVIHSCSLKHQAKHSYKAPMGKEEAKAVWRSADAVSFDVDSTVCSDEGIDELALFLGVGDKVKEVTNMAMGGSMLFQDSLRQRLDIMQPTCQDIERFITKHTPQLTHGIRDLVSTLHQRKIPVFLISGGFHALIRPVAEELHIPQDHIFANKLQFYYDGGYAGFDRNQPTSESGGKPKVIGHLKAKYAFKRLVHIGDGATDMEACPPADAFVGFGGVRVRDKVRQGAEWYVMSFQELLDELF